MQKDQSLRRTLFVVLLVAIIGVSVGGTLAADGPAVRFRSADLHPAAIVAMLMAAAAWIGLRFLRWQFLLRCAQIRVPIRPALAGYLAALPGIGSPGYVGELLRTVFLRQRFEVPFQRAVSVLILERLYDALAFAPVLALSGDADNRKLGAIVALAAIALMGLLLATMKGAGFTQTALDALRAPRTIGIAFGSSLLTWVCVGSFDTLAGLGLGHPTSLRTGFDVLVQSTLHGWLAWSSTGIGTAGSATVAQLESIGATAADAASIVALIHVVSLAVSIPIGAVFLLRELRTRHPEPTDIAKDSTKHFDTIAQEYNAQWSPHVWDLLLDRKLSLMIRALGHDRFRTGVGLDLGCGLGIQTTEMRRRGFHVIGLEPSVGLLRQRQAKDVPVVAGDALSLPLPDASVDFVYVIGVLHHLPGREAQKRALAELARVLKPGGLLLVHESNPRNPLFRFYMGYLFPLLKSIDEGTEWWLDPRTWATVDRFEPVDVQYFTFLPDFTPQLLMRPALAIERWLERGATRPFSAHYMAVVARSGTAGSNVSVS